MFIHKEPKEPTFNKVGITGRIFPASELASSAQFFTVETEMGHQTTIRQRECDFYYYILEGRGEFIVEEVAHPCEPGDLVTIPHGNWFRYQGKMRLLAVSVPPWWEEQEDTRE